MIYRLRVIHVINHLQTFIALIRLKLGQIPSAAVSALWSKSLVYFDWWNSRELFLWRFTSLLWNWSNSFLFLVLTLRCPGEGGPGNPKFGRVVSIAWPRIVPPMNQTRVLLNDSSFRGAH